MYVLQNLRDCYINLYIMVLKLVRLSQKIIINLNLINFYLQAFLIKHSFQIHIKSNY